MSVFVVRPWLLLLRVWEHDPFHAQGTTGSRRVFVVDDGKAIASLVSQDINWNRGEKKCGMAAQYAGL